MLEFIDLHEDVLLHIFTFLDPADLYTIRCLNVDNLTKAVNQSFKMHLKTMLITGTNCFPTLQSKPGNLDRLRVHHNWLSGKFQRKTPFDKDKEVLQVERLCLSPEYLFVGNRGEIRRYNRLKEDGSIGEDFIKFGQFEDPAISTIVVKGDQLFTGSHMGTCSYFKGDKTIIKDQKVHFNYKDIYSMDFNAEQQILAEANYREINLFAVKENQLDIVAQVDSSARCMKMDSKGDQLVIGNICTDFETMEGYLTTLSALSLYDIETDKSRDLYCTSSGVLDMVWHSSPSVILTGHWIGDLRMYDLRTGRDEVKIVKTGKEDMNCTLAYDGQHGVVCGFRTTSEVCLYDLRQPKAHVTSFGQFRVPGKCSHVVQVEAIDPRLMIVVNYEQVTICDFVL